MRVMKHFIKSFDNFSTIYIQIWQCFFLCTEEQNLKHDMKAIARIVMLTQPSKNNIFAYLTELKKIESISHLLLTVTIVISNTS